jgi:uncharacterized iron-regulated membrane protein
MKLRSVLFWLHLACGVTAGAVILIMSVTGALLTYQRQITAWADMRGYRSEPAPGATRLPADEIIAKVSSAQPDLRPTTIVLRSDPGAPASLAAGPARQIFVNPYSGAVLGDGNGQGVRDFFRRVVEWHRYVAMSGDSRPTGRAITGASNLMFLFIVLSGMFLWWPRTWTWAAVKSVVWFRGGLAGKARDFNWHNTIGFWSAIPLAIVVAGAVVISYPWATALVYRAYGEQPPAPAAGLAARGGGPGGRAGGPAARNGGPGRGTAQAGTEQRRADGPASEHRTPGAEAPGVPLETLVAKARTQMPEWKTISVALPSGNAPRVTLTLDAGDGGQPHKRATLTLNRRTGEVERWEPYSSQSAGRRARTWLRFAHTGEVYGLTGQTVAGIVTAGGAVLVWTGIALALRRLFSWRKRGRAAMQKAA